MEGKRIKVGITHGDINGIGYEVILKTFSDPAMLELCTPVIYGSPKVAAYHRKAMDIPANFSIVNTAADVQDGRVNVVNCINEELKVELSKPTPEAGKAAVAALEKAVEEYQEGLFDVLVAAPANKQSVQADSSSFSGHGAFLQERVGGGRKALTVLVKRDFRMALATEDIPVREIPKTLTKELLAEKIMAFHRSLKVDFGIDSPRIAVLGLNPHAGDDGLTGTEEKEVIAPALSEMVAKGIQCFGPYPADGLIGSGSFSRFDGILAMYHDQGALPFRLIERNGGAVYFAGLPVVYTTTIHGMAYDIVGKGVADDTGMRKALYLGMDVYRNRKMNANLKKNPLKHYSIASNGNEGDLNVEQIAGVEKEKEE